MDDSFWLFYGLWSLNGRNWTLYIFYGLVLWEVLVFVITKTTKRGKTPKFTVKFDPKLGGKNPTEQNFQNFFRF